jgi:hypothetical protein
MKCRAAAALDAVAAIGPGRFRNAAATRARLPPPWPCTAQERQQCRGLMARSGLAWRWAAMGFLFKFRRH